MNSGAMTVLLLAGLVGVVLCAPAPTLKKSPSNEVIVNDEEYLTQEERERVVAGLILQIARDFDDGFITQEDLEGRSYTARDDGDVAQKEKKESTKLSKDKVHPETPETPPQTPPLAT